MSIQISSRSTTPTIWMKFPFLRLLLLIRFRCYVTCVFAGDDYCRAKRRAGLTRVRFLTIILSFWMCTSISSFSISSGDFLFSIYRTSGVFCSATCNLYFLLMLREERFAPNSLDVAVARSGSWNPTLFWQISQKCLSALRYRCHLIRHSPFDCTRLTFRLATPGKSPHGFSYICTCVFYWR